MEMLLFRTCLAPLLVLAVSLVARNLGPRWGGRLLGAPTTSGPFLVVLCLGSGERATESAAHGSVAGQLSVACFCFVYGRLAGRRQPLHALLLSLATVAVAGVFEMLCGSDEWLTAAPALVLILINLPAATASMAEDDDAAPNPLRWQAIAVRMAISGTIVCASVGVAGIAGPFIGGLLCALPVLLTVMAPSLHRTCGADAAIELLRGALTSGAGTLAFLLVLCLAPVPLGAPGAFALALAALAAADRLARRATVRPAGRTAGRGPSVRTWPNAADRPTLRAIAHSSPVKTGLVRKARVSWSESWHCSRLPNPVRRAARRAASPSSARSGSSA